MRINNFVVRRVKKYFYNTDTHKFEKLVISWRTKLLRVSGFISASLVTALIIVAIAFKFLDSPKEKRMRGDVNNLRDQYEQLQNQINGLNKAIAELENRDNSIYRNIFEAAPLPDSIRYGKKYSEIDAKQYAYVDPDEMIEQIKDGLDILSNRIRVQKRSYDTLEHLVRSKEIMLQSIPAIQPISNNNLDHLASGFGYRIDPIYKTVKLHTGLDFAAPIGTPIYATGNGVVEDASYDAGGYGNHVVIDHGYGYETLYGHMIKIKARVGEHVKRGEVIGWVGSTGKSTGPHCHYEVIRNGEKIDPIHYFFNDLTASEYDHLVHIAAAGNQSFD
ncbi:MAG TPA: peptidoglycan DD-metalloendopeptidase family protein [Flavipsychrobacter sp.]|nr:peptidoglycan DD-metalloendopeptidase family protein [Flavipsychrobacter sp.]